MALYCTDPYWASVVLAMSMDGASGSTSFVDLKGHTVTPAGNVQLSTAQSKFGGASAYFDGSTDYLSLASSADFALGTADFTCECWVRISSVSGTFNILDFRSTASGIPWVWNIVSGKLGMYTPSGTLAAGSTTLSVGVWYHVAITRQSNIFTLWVNGVADGSATNSSDLGSSSNPLTIGCTPGGSGGGSFYGYIDDLRITKGVARDTANFTLLDSLASLFRYDVIAQIDLPYAIAGALACNQIDLPYRAATTLKAQIDLPYASRYRPRAQVDLPFTHRPTAKAHVHLPFGYMVRALAQVDMRYLFGSSLVRSQVDMPFAVVDRVSARSQVDLVAWGDAAPLLIETEAESFVVDGVAIDPLSIEFKWSRSQYAITATVAVATEAEYAHCAIGADAVLTLYGDEYRLRIEDRRRDRRHGQWIYTISCISPAAWLDAPFAETRTGDQLGLASVCAKQLAGELSLDWATVDWTLVPGDLSATDQTPLALIRQLASVPGGLMLSLPDGSMVIEPAYPVPVNRYHEAMPSAVIRETLDVISSTDDDDYRPGYNRYLVGDQVAAATGSLRIEPESESDMVYLLRVYQTPWADDFDFTHTGGDWVQLADLGIEESEQIEVVEFIAGETQTAKPVYGVSVTNWLQVDLGEVTASEDGRLISSVSGESLLSITYTTRCRLFRARNSQVEQVQFVAEVAS